MARAIKRAKTGARAKGGKQARKTTRRSVEVKDLPPADAVKAGATRRIVNKRAVVSGLGTGGLPSTSGEPMAKTTKKKKAAKAAKKSVAVKDLKAKDAQPKKAGMTAIRRRLV